MDLPAGPIMLYDGVCGLCHRTVKWLLHHERDHDLLFAPLQGETAAALRAKYPAIPATIDSVVLVADGVARKRSKAIMYASKHLRAPWRWAHAMRWVPGIFPDVFYRIIAKLRFRIWGHADACELPSPDNRARFLP